jgi:tetratricopeptide (TPR) repeat protein
VHLELAAIYRQAGRRDRALEAIDRAVQLAQAEGQLYTEAVAETERFEIEQEQGRLDEAAASLRRALERILTVRSLDLPVLSRAAIERQLARILEHYGDRDGVRRAYERALTESRGVSFELTATLTEMARASVTMADLELGRSALRSGVELGIESEGLLYLALWQLIVERTKSVPSNGLPVQVLEASGDLRGWLRGLRGWGLGRITGPELVRLADTKVEEVEGIFYTAILATF